MQVMHALSRSLLHNLLLYIIQQASMTRISIASLLALALDLETEAWAQRLRSESWQKEGFFIHLHSCAVKLR